MTSQQPRPHLSYSRSDPDLSNLSNQLRISSFFPPSPTTGGSPAESTTPSHAAPATPDGQRKVYTWLNSLTKEEAERLHNIINVSASHPAQQFPQAAIERLSQCTNKEHPERDGAFYLRWAECQVSNLTPSSTDEGYVSHARAKITIPKQLSPPSPIYSQIAKAVSKERLDEFNALDGPLNPTSQQVHLQVHHVAYNTNRDRPDFIPLEQCDRNASFFNFCEVNGCVRPDHLEFVRTMGLDTVRQRCQGITLLMGEIDGHGIILNEQPCLHAGSRKVTPESLSKCCRKIHVVTVDPKLDWPELDEQWSA
ncbi:hypothetical protein K449DRAFT_174599 [Hypoxylon sp. EC38]|nr:hypothetical protein K449DRAFT_174599 [Hypoxylon sp. EC38]